MGGRKRECLVELGNYIEQDRGRKRECLIELGNYIEQDRGKEDGVSG